jgi:16S rRNA G966 N2-methylase RsmD
VRHRDECYRGVNPLAVRGRDWVSLPAKRKAGVLSAAFLFWRRFGFPYYDLSQQELASEFNRLMTQGTGSIFQKSGALGAATGLRLANFFHPQMWSICVSRYRCPMEVFLDDDLLRRALAQAWSIWPDRFGANPSNLRRMLKTFTGTAAVSNFRPTLARAVIQRFSEPGSTVLDFSAGFGGRLVGCLTLERAYIGIEPCRDQVAGLRRNIRALRTMQPKHASARIFAGRAEHVLQRIASNSVELVFSSPPYYNWERYDEKESQSYVRYTSYQSWLAGFLEPSIHESYRTLRRRGHMVLNVSGKGRRPFRDDVLQIAQRAGFLLAEEIPMLLARVPYLHPRTQGPFKPELLLVFRKKGGVKR